MSTTQETNFLSIKEVHDVTDFVVILDEVFTHLQGIRFIPFNVRNVVVYFGTVPNTNKGLAYKSYEIAPNECATHGFIINTLNIQSLIMEDNRMDWSKSNAICEPIMQRITSISRTIMDFEFIIPSVHFTNKYSDDL